MDDWLQYIPFILITLITSSLIANLFSILFSHETEQQILTPTNPNQHQHHHHHQTDVITPRNSSENDNAEFSRKNRQPLLINRDNKFEPTDVDDEDWEDVEITELEDAFCAATAFIEAADRSLLSSMKVSSSLQLELYGLYKVATDGACNVPQPSAIKITARAKWNAWRKLGDMSQEEAMQKYLEIITELYPNWADGSNFKKRVVDNNETSSKDSKPMGPDFSSSMHKEDTGNELKLDAIHDSAREGDADNSLKHNSEGQMPLAVDHDYIDVAEKPMSRNADTTLKKDNEGETPLHSALLVS